MTADDADPPVETFAYYLPQYYPMPLNSTYWGEGFTEWSAVLKAQRGTRSPRDTVVSPGELGFYDLRLRDSRVAQGRLAQEHGLTAFAIYHYWSRGDRVMPEVVDRILADGAPDHPFFFCWANHDWTLGWQGKPEVVTWKQEYEAPDDDTHFAWLSAAFADPRYYRIGGSPVIAVYAPEPIPHGPAMFARWRELARQQGLPGVVLLGFAHGSPPKDPTAVGIDAWIEGAALPSVSRRERILPTLRTVGGIVRFLRHGDFRVQRDLLRKASRAARSAARGSLIPMVQPSWNNVGRRPRRSSYWSASAAEFETDLREAFRDAPVVRGGDAAVRLVAVNAWNEWGEAMTIEPTQEHGRGMLEALQRVTSDARAPR